MPSVRFTHTGHSHLVGNFGPGDLFTGSAEVCRHFVEEARCAEWATAPSAVQAPARAEKAKTNTETQAKRAKRAKAS